MFIGSINQVDMLGMRSPLFSALSISSLTFVCPFLSLGLAAEGDECILAISVGGVSDW